MPEVDEIVEEIKLIKEDLKNEVPQKQIYEKYKISKECLRDIQYMEDVDAIKTDIERIKKCTLEGKSHRETASELEYGSAILSYIAKRLNLRAGKQDRTQQINDEAFGYVNELEKMWKDYLVGDSIANIACRYGTSIENAEFLVTNFDKRIRRKRTIYHNKNFNRAEEAERLKRCLKLSDDVIEYILDGKPLNTGNSKNEEGDEGRDEL